MSIRISSVSYEKGNKRILDEGIIQHIDTMITSKAGMIICHEAPPKLPMVQKVRPLNSESELIKVNNPIPTEAKALTAIPISNIYVMPS